MMPATADDERDLAFIASETDPQMRIESARDIVGDCRRIVFRQMADASRNNNQPRVEALKAEQTKYDDELKLISKNDLEAIERALTVHARFLREYNRATKEGHKPPSFNGPG